MPTAQDRLHTCGCWHRDIHHVVGIRFLGGGRRAGGGGGGPGGAPRVGSGRGGWSLTQQRYIAPGAGHVTTGQLHLRRLAVREPAATRGERE